MTRVASCPLPDAALLQRYATSGGYTDCYRAALPVRVSHAAFVEAFYCTPLFKLERLVLRLAARRPSSDEQARQLATGERDSFAAWSVEARAPQQLLLCDFLGRTRSWLMVAPVDARNEKSTWLYFGSAVVPAVNSRGGPPPLGAPFSALLGVHRLYSRALLAAACRRLLANSQVS